MPAAAATLRFFHQLLQQPCRGEVGGGGGVSAWTLLKAHSLMKDALLAKHPVRVRQIQSGDRLSVAANWVRFIVHCPAGVAGPAEQ